MVNNSKLSPLDHFIASVVSSSSYDQARTVLLIVLEGLI